VRFQARRTWIAAAVCTLALAAAAAVLVRHFRTAPLSSKVYRIGYGDDAPFQFTSADGTATGVAVEIVREAARRRGIELQWVESANAGIGSILSGETDLWVLLTDRPERRTQIHVTEPYLTNERCFLVLKRRGYHSYQDLGGARLAYRAYWSKDAPPPAAGAGYPNADELYLKDSFPRAEPVALVYDNLGEVLAALRQGRADAALINKSIVGALLLAGGDRGQLDIVSAPDAVSPLALGSSFAAAEAADRIRDEMKTMAQDGAITRIAGRWGFFQSVSLDVIGRLSAAERANRFLLGGVLGLAAAIAFIGFLAMRLRNQRNAVEALGEKLISAQEEERARIARDLHDDLSQRVAALSIGLSNLKRLMTNGGGQPEQLDRLSDQVGKVAGSLRTISHSLHPAMLQHAGLVPALQSLVREFSESSGIRVSMEAGPLSRPVPPEVALCLYRIAQEALQNIAKHSGAAEARVRLTGSGRDLQLTVSDSGAGFPGDTLEKGAGLGIISMKERVRTVHGSLRVDTGPGHGTKVTARVPVSTG
jgi:signal transduction histidine kinase